MSLDSIDIAETSTLTVLHPTTRRPLLRVDGQPMTIELYGEDSERYEREVRRSTNKRSRQRGTPTAEQISEQALRLLAALTAGWTLEGDEGAIPLTAESAYQQYRQRQWLREQVDAHVHDRANYLGES